MAKNRDGMVESTGKIKLTTSDYVIRGIGYFFITIFAIASILPFLIILGTSFETEDNILQYGVTLFPRNFTTAAYELVVKGGSIWQSYCLTIVMTAIGLASMWAAVFGDVGVCILCILNSMRALRVR